MMTYDPDVLNLRLNVLENQKSEYFVASLMQLTYCIVGLIFEFHFGPYAILSFCIILWVYSAFLEWLHIVQIRRE